MTRLHDSATPTVGGFREVDVAQLPPSVREQAWPLLARVGARPWWVGAAVPGGVPLALLRWRRAHAGPRELTRAVA